MKRRLGFLDNLIHVKRYSGNPLIRQESVADHVWCMNSLALEFVPELNARFSTKFKIETVIYGIALHDVDESLYCDIPRNFKYHNQELREAIRKTVDSLLQSHLSKKLNADIRYFESKDNIYGCLIKILDITQAGLKMIDEINLGNSYFRSEIDNVFDSLCGMEDKINNSPFEAEYKDGLTWLCDRFRELLYNLLSGD